MTGYFLPSGRCMYPTEICSRPDQHRFSQISTHFESVYDMYKIDILLHRSKLKISATIRIASGPSVNNCTIIFYIFLSSLSFLVDLFFDCAFLIRLIKMLNVAQKRRNERAGERKNYTPISYSVWSHCGLIPPSLSCNQFRFPTFCENV